MLPIRPPLSFVDEYLKLNKVQIQPPQPELPKPPQNFASDFIAFNTRGTEERPSFREKAEDTFAKNAGSALDSVIRAFKLAKEAPEPLKTKLGVETEYTKGQPIKKFWETHQTPLNLQVLPMATKQFWQETIPRFIEQTRGFAIDVAEKAAYPIPPKGVTPQEWIKPYKSVIKEKKPITPTSVAKFTKEKVDVLGGLATYLPKAAMDFIVDPVNFIRERPFDFQVLMSVGLAKPIHQIKAQYKTGKAIKQGLKTAEERILPRDKIDMIPDDLRVPSKPPETFPEKIQQRPSEVKLTEADQIKAFERAGKVEQVQPGQFSEQYRKGIEKDIKGVQKGLKAEESLEHGDYIEHNFGFNVKKELKDSLKRMTEGGDMTFLAKSEAKDALAKAPFPEPPISKPSVAPTTGAGLAYSPAQFGTKKPLGSGAKARLSDMGKRSLILEHHLDYMNTILRETKVEIPKDFSNYKNFQDTGRRSQLSSAPHYWVPKMDGKPSLKEMAKMEGAASPAVKYILQTGHDIIVQAEAYKKNILGRIERIQKGTGSKHSADRIAIGEILKQIDYKNKNLSVDTLVSNPFINKHAGKPANLTLIEKAIEIRKLYDDLFAAQNEIRVIRGQKLIQYRGKYSPDMIRKITVWERTKGLLDKTEYEFRDTKQLPDYIYPDKPFNPHEMAKKFKLSDIMKETDPLLLAQEYLGTAVRDIFNTSIVKNNKAFAAEFDRLGYPGNAQAILDFTAESFGGVKSVIDRSLAVSKGFQDGMREFRKGLHRSVFPGYVAWTAFIQTSSSALTVMRYKPQHSVKGMIDWITKPKLRQEIANNTYSYIIKKSRAGDVARQELVEGMARSRRLDRSPLQKAEDVGNYFVREVEKFLTGWSNATAKAELDSMQFPKGRSYWERVSEGGAKTQSLYNLEDRPGFLRSHVVRTVAPFQTFSFEVFNTLRETVGRTGMGQGSKMKRLRQVVKLAAYATAWNTVSNATITRKPWNVTSAIPMYNQFMGPVIELAKGKEITTRHLPSPVQVAADFIDAGRRIIEKDDWAKMRRWLTRYGTASIGIPGGQSISNMVEGLIAMSKDGVYDARGKMLFPVRGTLEDIRAMTVGPYRTKAAQEYFDKDKKKKTIYYK